MAEVEPIYEELPGWQSDTTGVRNYADLPLNARLYLERLSEVADIKLGIISVGPGRDQTIVMHEIFE